MRGFAARIGVAPPFVTDIEANRRRPGQDVLAKIAAVLDLPLEELQALDPRLTPEVKEWIEEEPRVGTLLRRLSENPQRDVLLGRIEDVVRDRNTEEE